MSTSDERYDYLYTPDEIHAFGETLKAVKKIVRKAYGYMNNHADAKSVAKANTLPRWQHAAPPGDSSLRSSAPRRTARSLRRAARARFHGVGRRVRFRPKLAFIQVRTDLPCGRDWLGVWDDFRNYLVYAA